MKVYAHMHMIGIETVCIVTVADSPNRFNDKISCSLETITLVSIASNLIIPSKTINNYI
jgi:hypothetical protein